MKRKDFEKLKNKSQAELAADLATSREKLWQVSKDIMNGKLKNVREVRTAKTDIAQLLTLINAKKVTK